MSQLTPDTLRATADAAAEHYARDMMRLHADAWEAQKESLLAQMADLQQWRDRAILLEPNLAHLDLGAEITQDDRDRAQEVAPIVSDIRGPSLESRIAEASEEWRTFRDVLQTSSLHLAQAWQSLLDYMKAQIEHADREKGGENE